MSNQLTQLDGVLKKRERRKQKERVESTFIFNDDAMPQKIDHAIGHIAISNERLRYFGVRLPVRFHTSKGEVIKEVEAIVTEDRQILSESIKPDNLNFAFSTKMNLKVNRWSKDSIKSFVGGIIKDVTYKDAYQSILKLYNEAMVFENPTDYEYNALWDLLTYHHDIIEKTIIEKKEGVSGSAKSKGMRLSSNLSFNGRKWLRPNPANFFRYRNNNKATLYIEEAERLFDDNKKKQSGDDELVEYLNASYEKGNFVPRQNKDNPDITDEFEPFGFTQIGSIKPLKGALEKRSRTQLMIRAKANDKRADVEIGPANEPVYQTVRDKSYICSLLHYRQFKQELSTLKNKWNMANREWLISKPIIALASCIDKELADRVGLYLEKCFEVRDIPIDSGSFELILIDVLISETAKSEECIFISNEHLGNRFHEELDKIDSNHRKVSQKAITTMVKALGFSNFIGHNSDKTERGLTLGFFGLLEILIRNGKITLPETLKKVSELSELSVSVGKIEKWFTDTFTDTLSNNVSGYGHISKLSGPKIESVRNPLPSIKTPLRTLRTHFSEKEGFRGVFLPCSRCGVAPSDSIKVYETRTGAPVCELCLQYEEAPKNE